MGQLVASSQFTLSKDRELLEETPSTGLRMTLLSYQTRGALIGEELFSQLVAMMDVADDLSSRLIKEKASRVEAEKRAATLEAEREGVDAKWRVELEAKQFTITGLQKHYTKQSASLKKLKEETTQLKKKAEGAEREVVEWRKQIEELETQMQAEKLEKQSAQKVLQSERLALQNLRVELDKLKAAHEKSLANVNSMEARLKFVSSEEGKKEVIEEYRHGPFAKVELSLAVKAGFDYLRAQVPSDVLSSSSFTYPPRVQSCLPVLQGLKERGARVRLDVEDKNDDEEDEDDGEGDDDDDDDEDGGEGGN